MGDRARSRSPRGGASGAYGEAVPKAAPALPPLAVARVLTLVEKFEILQADAFLMQEAQQRCDQAVAEGNYGDATFWTDAATITRFFPKHKK